MILLMGTLSFLWSWKAMDLWLWKWSPEVIYCSLVCLATWELLSSQLSNLVKAFPKWKWLRFHLQVLMLKTLLTPPCSTHCASNTWSLIFFLGRPWFWEAPSLKWVSHFILGGMIFFYPFTVCILNTARLVLAKRPLPPLIFPICSTIPSPVFNWFSMDY